MAARSRRRSGAKKKAGKRRPQEKEEFKAVPFAGNLGLFFIIAAIFIFVFGRIDNFLFKSGRFDIRKIEVLKRADGELEAAPDMNLGIDIGDNIFKTRLGRIYADMKRRYPQFKDIRVKRVLPDKLIVEYEERRAFARVIIARTYLIDKDGILIGNIRSRRDISGKDKLPLIVGISPPAPVSIGERLDPPRISLALDIIKKVRAHPALKNITVEKVDISNLSNASFFTDGDIRVKIGDKDIDRRLDRLADALKHIDTEDRTVKYLDLRFNDVVIGAR